MKHSENDRADGELLIILKFILQLTCQKTEISLRKPRKDSFVDFLSPVARFAIANDLKQSFECARLLEQLQACQPHFCAWPAPREICRQADMSGTRLPTHRTDEARFS